MFHTIKDGPSPPQIAGTLKRGNSLTHLGIFFNVLHNRTPHCREGAQQRFANLRQNSMGHGDLDSNPASATKFPLGTFRARSSHLQGPHVAKL